MTAQRLTIKDATEVFPVSYTKLYEAIKADELPAIQLGRVWTVKPDDVETWIQRVGTPNGAAS